LNSCTVKQRNSKNRQAILECLMGTKSHPTAEWVYEKLKPDYPNLSLGTVYRNISQLKENGSIRSMGSVAGLEHLDADVSVHHHLICERCGRIDDIDSCDETVALMKKLEEKSGFVINEMKFVGLCKDCALKAE